MLVFLGLTMSSEPFPACSYVARRDLERRAVSGAILGQTKALVRWR